MTAILDSSGSAAPRARAQTTNGHGAPFSQNRTRYVPFLIVDATSGYRSTRGAFTISVYFGGEYRASIALTFNPNKFTKTQLEIEVAKVSGEIVEASKWISARECGPFKALANDDFGAVGGTTAHGNRSHTCWISIVPFRIEGEHWPKLNAAIERCAVRQWTRHFQGQREWRIAEPIMSKLGATPQFWDELPSIPTDVLPKDSAVLERMALIGFPSMSIYGIPLGAPSLWEEVGPGSVFPIKHGTPVMIKFKAARHTYDLIYGYDEALFTACKAQPYMVCRAWARTHDTKVNLKNASSSTPIVVGAAA